MLAANWLEHACSDGGLAAYMTLWRWELLPSARLGKTSGMSRIRFRHKRAGFFCRGSAISQAWDSGCSRCGGKGKHRRRYSGIPMLTLWARAALTTVFGGGARSARDYIFNLDLPGL